MLSSSFKQFKSKNSQEIISYLQKQESHYNPILRNLISRNDEKIIYEQEDLPHTRMHQFFNKNEKISNQMTNNIFNKSKENKIVITKLNSTPKFNWETEKLDTAVKEIKLYKSSKKGDSSGNKISYLDFDLHENIYQNEGELLHLYLPKKYKDNERYKSKLYKFLKSEVKNGFTFKSKNTKLKGKMNNKNFQREFLSKSKKPYSVKIKNNCKITYNDLHNNIYTFSLFRDNMIGFDKKWQESIIIQDLDNDIESDDEQIRRGKEKMIKDVKKGIIQWARNKKLCSNYKYISIQKDHNSENKNNCIC